MIDAAVAAQLTETNDLDWKRDLPPTKALNEHEFPKDVAAMANSGGGVIVYGVEETDKRATGRRDVGHLSERHESTLRSAAITAITPPILGLGIYPLGALGNQVVAVVVPASADSPHLIYRDQYFGAPLRNDADTVWMKERQVEAQYRARFDERRHTTEALDNLYEEANTNWNSRERVWLITVAHPRLPATPASRQTQDSAREVLAEAVALAAVYAGGGIHPITNVDRFNPRRGLRRWVARNTATSDTTKWKAAWMAIHDDGSVSLAAAVGGRRSGQSGENLGLHQVESAGVECAVTDFMALLRATSNSHGIGEYEVRIGLEWGGPKPLTMVSANTWGEEDVTPLRRFSPITATVTADASALDFYWQVHDLAEDCVNQGGMAFVQMISPPARDGSES